MQDAETAGFFPESREALLLRAQTMAGWRLETLANALAIDIPNDLKRNKGWIGQTIERYLGATAGSVALPDFPHLGIELKTIPVNAEGEPLETTFVTFAPLQLSSHLCWEQSHVRQKLQKVLWIPVEGDRTIPLSQRRIGRPIFHELSESEEAQLKADWLELMEMIALGQIEQITARLGTVLQLRPKALNGRALTATLNESGDMIYARPRGFYLRKSFTSAILKQFLKAMSDH